MKIRQHLIILFLSGLTAAGATEEHETPKFRSAEDGAFDVSSFLDEAYGFIPILMPITEPAVGYGAAGGLAFIDKPLGAIKNEYARPSVSMVGGFGTENGSWGAAAGDMRHWFDDRLQTLVGMVHASVNLDFYGIGDDSMLNNDPLEYNLETTGGLAQGKFRMGDSRLFGGLGYVYFVTDVTFDAPPTTPGLPSYSTESNVGGITPSLTYDTRDNIFTPLHGTYVEAQVGLFDEALGSDDSFQRSQIIAMQFLPLHPRWTLGLRGAATTSSSDTPFYLRPYVNMRGVEAMRYQGDDMAQLEAELRWQFWKRYSVVGFSGAGMAWNDFEKLEDTQSVISGGFGFRYELAREYGIHAGLDLAFSEDTTAFYIQVGSAWARP